VSFDKRRAVELLAPRLSPPPWRAQHDDEGSTVVAVGRAVARLPYNRNPWDHDDAEFIAESRTLLPAASERIERLEQLLAEATLLAIDGWNNVTAMPATKPAMLARLAAIRSELEAGQ
jgi:hypothetical protein